MPTIIDDPLHGTIAFDEPLLEALLRSDALRRLVDVDMGGYSKAFFPGVAFSRLEHAIGVSHLLRLGGAGLEEQAHGLLHDVNHTVFSHAVDYALAEGNEECQSHQDEDFAAFVAASALPDLLRAGGLDPQRVTEAGNFPLAEQPLPALCADRLDYAFRTMLHHRTLPPEQIRALLAALRSDGARWYFATQDTAAAFALAFQRIDREVMSSFTSAAMFRAIGDCLSACLMKGVLQMVDLHDTETSVLARIESAAAEDAALARLWARMSGRTPAVPSEAPEAGAVACKARVVDPLFDTGEGVLQPLSAVLPEWRRIVAEGLTPVRYRFRFLD